MDSYAGFWIRFLAALLNFLILDVPALILLGLIVWSGAVEAAQYLPGIAAMILFIYTEGRGGSPGKRIVGIRLQDENGDDIGTIGALFRQLGKILSTAGLCIGYIWIGFDEKKQGWHDKLAKTYVVWGSRKA